MRRFERKIKTSQRNNVYLYIGALIINIHKKISSKNFLYSNQVKSKIQKLTLCLFHQYIEITILWMCLKISERSVALGITCISYTYMYAEHDFKMA